MNYAAWTMLPLALLAAISCGGKLDGDYYGSSYQGGGDYSVPEVATPQNPSMPSAGSGWHAGAGPDAADAGVATSQAGSAAQPWAAGSGGTSPSTCDFKALVQMHCANPSCHLAPAASSGLDLSSPMLAARVLGRMAIGSCQDKLLIDQAQPEQSAIYLRVSGSSCGPQMPLNGTPLSADDRDCVLSWIEGL